jgi:hypothetical protein
MLFGSRMREPVKLQLEYRDDCLVIQPPGRDIVDRMAATLQAISAAILAKPIRASLIDLRAVPGNFSFLSRYQLGAMAGLHLPRVPIAVLANVDQPDPKRIGQLAAQNRGVNVEIFTDPAAAEAWLKNVPPIGSNPPMKPV